MEKKKIFTIILGLVLTSIIAGGIFWGIRYFMEKSAVNKLISTYQDIDKATQKYMKDNNCENNISKCISRAEGKNEWDYMDTSIYFKGISDNLGIVDYACNNNFVGKDWLAATPATLMDGSTQTEAWEAPTKAFKDGYTNANCYYLLKNGAVMHVQFPDNQKQSGFGTVDINGKKGPNQIGKDIFPVGWGAAGNSSHWASKGLNPFWAEDGYATEQNDFGNRSDDYNFEGVQTGLRYRGLCRISCPKCDCKPDENSPTYYVLQYKKMPKIK